jgi:tetratricopeptide (TPR) repeat protein
VGVFMAERFLFLPSLGLILALVLWAYPWVISHYRKVGAVCLGAGILIFSIWTIKRNQAWRDNETLMRTDINISFNSAALRNHFGTFLLDEALQEENLTKKQQLLEEAILHLEKAVELHPNYFDALLANGACHYYLMDYGRAVQDYRTALVYYAGDEQATLGLWYALLAFGKVQWDKGDKIQAINSLTEAWDIHPDADNANQISAFLIEMGDTDKAMEWKAKASSVEN